MLESTYIVSHTCTEYVPLYHSMKYNVIDVICGGVCSQSSVTHKQISVIPDHQMRPVVLLMQEKAC